MIPPPSFNPRRLARLAACATVAFAALAAHAQTDEIQVYDANIVEQGKFNLTLHDNYTPSSEDSAKGTTARKAFEPGESPGWSSGNATNQAWLQYEFNGPAWAITQYTLTSSGGNADADPRDWDLQGSNDGGTWTTLDKQTGQT